MEHKEKIIGYGLLILGLLLILIPLAQTIGIFMGKTSPPQIFTRPAALQLNQNVGSFDFQKQIENAFIKMIPIELIDNVLNLISWLILMWILMFGGKQIADLGIKLIKN
jgi:hypothetical protein